MSYAEFMPAPNFANLSGSVPAYYDMQNFYGGSFSPSTVHLKDNALYALYMRYFMEKAISAFEWKMPESWSKDYFLYVMYSWGYMAVFDTWQYGLVAQFPALRGFTMMYQPRSITITNQWFTNLNRVIGVNCVLFKVMPDYRGLTDIISHYAQEMALAWESLSVNLNNSKLAYMFGVDDKNVAQDMKKLYDNVSRGEPAVFFKKRKAMEDSDTPLWQTFTQNIGQNYISDQLIADMRKIENAFDTWFGIPNTNYEKRERMSTTEVSENNADTETFSGKLLRRMQESCEQVNRMFKGDIMSVDWNRAIKSRMGERNDLNAKRNE